MAADTRLEEPLQPPARAGTHPWQLLSTACGVWPQSVIRVGRLPHARTRRKSGSAARRTGAYECSRLMPVQYSAGSAISVRSQTSAGSHPATAACNKLREGRTSLLSLSRHTRAGEQQRVVETELTHTRSWGYTCQNPRRLILARLSSCTSAQASSVSKCMTPACNTAACNVRRSRWTSWHPLVTILAGHAATRRHCLQVKEACTATSHLEFSLQARFIHAPKFRKPKGVVSTTCRAEDVGSR